MKTKLLRLTAKMPMKQIDINDKPYLQRYYAGETACGTHDIWIHRFLSEDGDRHVHNHPFVACSIVLSGGYDEQIHGKQHRTREASLVAESVVAALDFLTPTMFIGHQAMIDPFHWHRIENVLPETWTLMIVNKKRLPFWYFMDGGKYTQMKSSPVDWWIGCGKRMIRSAGDLIAEHDDLTTESALNIFKNHGEASAEFYNDALRLGE